MNSCMWATVHVSRNFNALFRSAENSNGLRNGAGTHFAISGSVIKKLKVHPKKRIGQGVFGANIRYLMDEMSEQLQSQVVGRQ